MVFSNTSVQSKAMNLGFYELLGNADSINYEIDRYNRVSTEMIFEAVSGYLSEANCSTLHYQSVKPHKKR
jgi:zinc protease